MSTNNSQQSPTPTPFVNIQQKITQKGCGSGCGMGCAIGGVIILAIALLLTKSCAVAVDAVAKHAQKNTPAATPPRPATRAITNAAPSSAATQAATPAPTNAAPSTGRHTSLPLVDVRERVAAMAEDHVRAKLSPKRLELLDLERRELESATLWIQRVSADGKTYRTGVLQTGDDLKLLTPAELKPHLLRQSH